MSGQSERPHLCQQDRRRRGYGGVRNRPILGRGGAAPPYSQAVRDHAPRRPRVRCGRDSAPGRGRQPVLHRAARCETGPPSLGVRRVVETSQRSSVPTGWQIVAGLTGLSAAGTILLTTRSRKSGVVPSPDQPPSSPRASRPSHARPASTSLRRRRRPHGRPTSAAHPRAVFSDLDHDLAPRVRRAAAPAPDRQQFTSAMCAGVDGNRPSSSMTTPPGCGAGPWWLLRYFGHRRDPARRRLAPGRCRRSNRTGDALPPRRSPPTRACRSSMRARRALRTAGGLLDARSRAVSRRDRAVDPVAATSRARHNTRPVQRDRRGDSRPDALNRRCRRRRGPGTEWAP